MSNFKANEEVVSGEIARTALTLLFELIELRVVLFSGYLRLNIRFSSP